MAEVWTHPKCGKMIRQHGNRTGHCAACCETFEGISLFDAHQRISPDGTPVCLSPEVMTFRGQPLRIVDGSWRGPAFENVDDVFKTASDE